MKTLCLIIPTYNRPECIEHYLEKRLDILNENSIITVIYDSSDNDLTMKVVEQYYNKGYDNLFYDRYEGKVNNNAIDHKVFSAYSKYAVKYDYTWFSSDGAILNFETAFQDIIHYMECDYSLIITDCLNCKLSKDKEYTNAIELFRECTWFMTLLSSVIVSKRIARLVIERYPVKQDGEFFFWLPMVYFYLLPNVDASIIHYSNNEMYEVNKKRDDSFWKLNGNALWQWSKIWYEAVYRLPTYYDSEKKYVVKSFDENMKIFSLIGLLKFKENGNLSLKNIDEYKYYLKKVTNTNIKWFYVVEYLCNRAMLRYLKIIVKKIMK